MVLRAIPGGSAMPRSLASLALVLFASAVAAGQTLPSVTHPLSGATVGGSDEPFQPKPDYLLTARQGPFMVYICSFHGDNAGPLAQDLAKELRDTYKLKAFLLRRV